MSSSLLLDNRFDVHEPVGQGGMGVVFLGHDRQNGRRVAIKTLRADAAEWQPSALERFQREAELLRQLNHPNIVQVFAIVEQDGDTYIVMEYVEGGSLAARLRRDPPLPLGTVLSIALDVADAMTRVHRLGILHRDLKPENVLLAADGSARLSDFGIALLKGGNALTQAGGIVGTPHYLSPEALTGEALDARSDVWAFGVVLFEMLAGRPPFTGDQVARIMMSVMTDRVPDLEALRPDAPVALVDLVYRMLEKDPQARLRSVRLAGAELEALLDSPARTPRGDEAATLALEPVAAVPGPFTSTPTSARRGSLHNLPAQTTPFVGRRKELAELERLVRDTRLVTVLGVGGSGKTRVAQELGGALLERFDGVFFVSLAPLRDTGEIVTAVADAVGLGLQPGIPRDAQLLAWLRDRRLLLILDNFEHLLDGTVLASAMLDAAAHLTIVATSREPLGLSAETVFRLDGVDVPDRDTPADQLARFGAVELFLQSARRAYPAFEPAGDDLAHIATIGRVVGGIPLAIMLASSWVEVLRPEEILREIRANLDFLERDQHRGDDRHRSMHVVFDAAWERLGAEERGQFARMSVFRGGFTREAAQAITGASLRALAALVRHCLLQRDPSTGRYDVHELVRQYAELRLLDSRGKEEAGSRHASWYGDLVARLEPRLGGADKDRARAELDMELDNIRAAWDGAVERCDLSVIARTVGGLATFYGLRTMNEEAVTRLGAALDAVRRLPDAQRPLDLELGLQVRAAGFLMNLKGYGHPDVGAGFTRAHELCQQLGPSPMLAPVMFGLWAFNIIGANNATADPLARQVLAIGESAGDPVLEIGGHHASSGSSVVAGRLSEAVAHATRVMELYRPEYDPLIIAYFADHSASASRGWHSLALNAMGHLDRARAVERDMLVFIEHLGHGQSHAQGLIFLGSAASVRRDRDAEVEQSREMQRVAVRYGLPVYAAFAGAFLNCSTATPASRESLLPTAALVRDGFGFKCLTIMVTVIRRAELELAAGDAQAARATVEESLAWMRAQGEHFWEAEALRVRADAERALGNAPASEASYRAAIDVAHEQGARLFELRAACGLGRLWQGQGRGAEARSILQPLYEGITEGRDCVDLREAAALLAELER